MDEAEKYLKALVLLELQNRAEEPSALKPELVLSRAGFTTTEVAELLGKSKAAAAKAISRAKKAGEI